MKAARKNDPQPQTDTTRKLVSELPPKFRKVFPYVSFNHVQSIVFDTVLETNKPLVVSAPTGSGKTGVFELAIIKVILDSERRHNIDFGAAKIVYLAPTKALCSERRSDWSSKFRDFNIQCHELTSDMTSTIDFKSVQRSCILLATPEKWDSITRNWSGHKSFVQSIRLLLVDEVHLVNDGPRGATLEAVISRMNTIRSIIWPSEPDKLRFIAVSATISNVQDISTWFSTPTSQAQVYQVDSRERPVKLRTLVLGYTANKDMNEFSFDNLLNHKLTDVIKQYSNEKPTLIFCATRKSAVTAASTLVKEGKFDAMFSHERRKMHLLISSQIKDKTLQETTRFGIAFHHAGLTAYDRRQIETNFLDGRILVLCCTSTLAMGVNLPAHLVVIKNTSFYDAGKFKPYTESSLVQMIGRAGRPQFDTEATAVIMTKSYCREQIEKMLTGKLIVESQLHNYLTEHLNSEIVLGTVADDSIARKWIDSTYLHVRLRKNPENYGLMKNSSATVIEKTITKWCSDSIELLLKYNICIRTKQGKLESTNSGRAMARHYICLSTMIKLIQLKGTETLGDLLAIICSCQELVGDIQLRIEDRPTLHSFVNPKDETMKLRYPIDKVDTREKKANALIQATFGNINMTENSILQESTRVVKNARRVMNCLRDIAIMNNDINYKLLSNIMTLVQCFSASLWEDSIYVSKQLERIGAVLSRNLAANGLTTFELLRKSNPRNIEIFCGRLPPFGSSVQQTCFGLPIYDLNIYFKTVFNHHDKVQLMVEVSLVNGQDLRKQQSLPRNHMCILLVGNLRDDKLLLRQQIGDAGLISRPDLTLCFGAEIFKSDLPSNHEDIEGIIMSEVFVGLNIKKTVKYIEPIDDEPSQAMPC